MYKIQLKITIELVLVGVIFILFLEYPALLRQIR